MKFSRSLTTMVLAVGACALASAETPFSIVYSFDAGSAAPTGETADVTATDAAWAGVAGGFSSSSNTAFVQATLTGSTLDLANYIEFRVDAQNSELLSFDNVVFNFGGSSNFAEFTASTTLRIGEPGADFSTLSDMSLTPGPTTVASKTIVGGSSPVFDTFSADLSDAAYQGVDSLVFRFYVFDNTDFTNHYDRFDDVTINGAIIPEPGATALIAGLGIGAIVWMRRRKAQRA